MRIIIKWQEKGEKPPLSVISCENSECKFWFSRWELLFIYRGILCIRWINSGTGKEGYKICVPRKLRSVILWQLHDSNCAGHMGEKRTLAKVRSLDYYWPRMRQSVHDYVLSCDICEERKDPPRKKRSCMKQYFSGEPFERIAIDITGPFPKSDKGYSYLLVVADYFTKFMEIFPLVNLEAETVAEVILRAGLNGMAVQVRFIRIKGDNLRVIYSKDCAVYSRSTKLGQLHIIRDPMEWWNV